MTPAGDLIGGTVQVVKLCFQGFKPGIVEVLNQISILCDRLPGRYYDIITMRSWLELSNGTPPPLSAS